MAHFAKLDDNNKVLAVHVVNNEVITIDGTESEQAGIDFLTSLHGHELWKQTSYNGSFRNKYAAIGDVYDSDLDKFIKPKPYPSWTLDSSFHWVAPIEKPESDTVYYWDEQSLSWVESIPAE
jgi:hypothetical protein